MEILEVTIDFDAASKAWRENKRRLHNGQFIYTCTQCKRVPKRGQLMCCFHTKKN